MSLEFFIDMSLPAALMILGSESLTEVSSRGIFWGIWQTYHLYVRVSWNLGASTSWNFMDRTGIALPFA